MLTYPLQIKITFEIYYYYVFHHPASLLKYNFVNYKNIVQIQIVVFHQSRSIYRSIHETDLLNVYLCITYYNFASQFRQYYSLRGFACPVVDCFIDRHTYECV